MFVQPSKLNTSAINGWTSRRLLPSEGTLSEVLGGAPGSLVELMVVRADKTAELPEGQAEIKGFWMMLGVFCCPGCCVFVLAFGENPRFQAPSGGLYVCELHNHRLCRWSFPPGPGTVGTVILGGLGRGAGMGQLAGPRGLCGLAGAIYVAEQGKVSCWYPQNKGFCLPGDTFLGTKELPLLEPSAVCVHEGWLYVADSKTHIVSRWLLEDSTVGQIVAGGRGPGDGLDQLNRPTGLAVDSAGRLYVSEARIQFRYSSMHTTVGLNQSLVAWILAVSVSSVPNGQISPQTHFSGISIILTSW